MFPILIMRNICHLAEKKNYFIDQISWYAEFADGSNKTIHYEKKVKKDIVKESDYTSSVLMKKDECALFHKDWSLYTDGQTVKL
jgi:hypothetical protein